MDAKYLEETLQAIQKGEIDIKSAMERLRNLPFRDLGYAKVDHHRSLRKSVSEVIYSEGKTPDQMQGIALSLSEHGENILATRASRQVYEAIQQVTEDCLYYEIARIVVIKPRPVPRYGNIAVVCAGTSDMHIGEEAAVTAEVLGNRVNRIYDVGVAGIHRLISVRDDLYKARVVIVIAGMEGALASVVGGLVSCPVIGVPTSVGYGASFNGIAPLLSMLNSCSSGVSVVNIDNGFGAAYQASLINQIRAEDEMEAS